MRLIFDIATVLAIVALMVKLFSRALPSELEERERNLLLRIVILGIIYNLGIIIFWYGWAGGHEFSPAVSDAYVYDWGGQYFANRFKIGDFSTSNLSMLLEDRYLGYYYFLGIIYAIFGHYHLIASIFNVLASIAIGLLMYQVSASLFDNRIARWTLIISLFFPQYVSASYFILKDMVLTFLVVGVFWAIYCRKNGLSSLLLMLMFLLLLSFFRLPQATILGAIAMIQFFILRLKQFKREKRLFSVAISVFLLFFSFAIIYQYRLGGSSEPKLGYTTRIPTYHSNFQGLIGRGERLEFNLDTVRRTGEIMISMPWDFFSTAVESIIRTFYGPFYLYARVGPNLRVYDPNGTIFRALFESLGGLFMAIMMPMVVIGAIQCWREKRSETLIFFIFIAAQLMILIFIGNIFRWRLPILPFVLMFGAFGIKHFDKVKPFYIPYLLLFNLFIAANATMRESFVVAKPLFLVTALALLSGVIWHRKSVL